MTERPHYPVMLPEVLEALAPMDGQVYVDGTFGAGGYTAAILDAANCTVIGIDRDVSVSARVEELKHQYGDRFVFLQGRFGDVANLLDGAGVAQVDGFVLDVGVSSMQLDQAERGFSFRYDAPLDMRMDGGGGGKTAADIVNGYEEEALANLIYELGGERKSRRVAKQIVLRRTEKPLETTFELADAARAGVGRSKDKIDPATRTFQAIRIAVNDELGELDSALVASENILNDGGRLVVVSFHSLEDGRVKKFLRDKSGSNARVSRYMPEQIQEVNHAFSLPKRKAIKPSESEISENPRSRSARMRVGVRTRGVA